MKATHILLSIVVLVLLQRCTTANSAQLPSSDTAMEASEEAAIKLEPEIDVPEAPVEQPKEIVWTYPQPWINQNLEKFHGEFERLSNDSILTRMSIFSENGQLKGRIEIHPNDSSCIVKEINVPKALNGSQLYIEVLDSMNTDSNSSTVLTFQGDSLSLDVTYHSNVRITYDNQMFARIYEPGTDEALFKQNLDLSSIHVAFTGKQDNSTFPQMYEDLEWQAVANYGQVTHVFPVGLVIGKEEVQSEMHGYYTEKEVKLDDMRYADFLISGIPSQWISNSHSGGSFEKKEFAYGEWNNIIFPESDWRIIQTGSQDDYGAVNTELVLMGTKNGKNLTQVLDDQPFREYYARYKWIGDLDGDGYPDFIFNISPKGYEDYRLYLSSQAGENELVKETTEFLATQLGC
ncbi:MAG: hypothetical protein AB8B53_01890 [Flavobacteriales bacterium]